MVQELVEPGVCVCVWGGGGYEGLRSTAPGLVEW